MHYNAIGTAIAITLVAWPFLAIAGWLLLVMARALVRAVFLQLTPATLPRQNVREVLAHNRRRSASSPRRRVAA